MRAGGGEGGAVGGGGGAIAGDGGDGARGIDAADALVVGIGEVEIAFGIERDVAGLLEAAAGRTGSAGWRARWRRWWRVRHRR